MIRVLIADDQALVRGGFRLILETQKDIEVVGEAEDGEDALAQARELRPDVVLMDIRMPTMDGLEATRRLLSGHAAPRVLVLTTFDADEYVYEAMKAGASGFLLKDVRPEQLADAVRVVASGDALLAPAITRRLIEDFVRRPPPGSGPPSELAELSERELEVLKLIAQGPLQRRDRRLALPQRGDRQDPRHPHPRQARPPRPRAGRRPLLRVRAGPARTPVAPPRELSRRRR